MDEVTNADLSEAILVAGLGMLGAGLVLTTAYGFVARHRGAFANDRVDVPAPRWVALLVLIGIVVTVFGVMVFVGNRPAPSPN